MKNRYEAVLRVKVDSRGANSLDDILGKSSECLTKRKSVDSGLLD